MNNTRNNNLKFGNSFYSAIRCMICVVYSLFLRETVSMYGDRRLGYLWVIVKLVFNIAVFAVLRMALGAKEMGGMHVIYYLMIGFTVINIFSDCANKCLTAVSANTAMLEFPHVKPLDIMIARCLLAVATNLVVALIVIVVCSMYGIPFIITDISKFIILLWLVVIFCMSFGICLASLNVHYQTVGKIFPFINRILFFVSGVFFSIDGLPTAYKEILSLNPILQIITGFRESVTYVIKLQEICSIQYISFVSLGLLAVGLLLEQYSHRKLEL